MSTPAPPPLSRRRFLALAAAGAPAAFAACRATAAAEVVTPGAATLTARPGTPTERATAGLQRLGLGGGRDGFLYVPPTYRADRPAPLLVLLHGAGHDATEWSSGPLPALVDGHGIVVGPDSRGSTWDRIRGGYGPDVRFIDQALALAFRRCNVDPARVGLGGFSDGASYALSLGIGNGDLFRALLAFSPGLLVPEAQVGTPRIFVSHGTEDVILPIDLASRRIVPLLRQHGYDVTYREFVGGHTVTVELAREAFQGWFMGGATAGRARAP